MPAPTDNSFWQYRTRHGRVKMFATPEILWDAACSYFEWIDNNPLYKVDYCGAIKVLIPKPRPYTWSGLQLFLGVNSFRHYKTNPVYKQFHDTIERIDNIIYVQKFEGACVGLFNPCIIARDLGLHGKRKKTASLPAIAPPSVEEVKRILAAIDSLLTPKEVQNIEANLCPDTRQVA